jgi:Na+/H+ antiporter NhaD/arsenite permease-like protein
MAQAWTEQQRNAELQALSFDERFGLLVDAEWLARENKRLARALQEAKLKLPQACLEAIEPEKVYREVNWQLLVLFVLSGGIEKSGLVEDLLGMTSSVGLYRPVVLTAATAVLSNLVSNVPAVLLFKPLIPSFGEPDRGWLILAMASTLAGNLTILGSVANLIVVEAAREARIEIGFLEYCRVGVPLTIVTLLLGWLILIAVPA